MGKPHKFEVRKFGDYSINEALFRWNMVQSAIDTTSVPNAAINSALFNAMDPTEKGWINFNLGMIFTKICAQDVLGVPWLIHLHWMKKNHDLTLLAGELSPDFLGYRPSSAHWGVFEAKGRSSGLSRALLSTAKTQANHLVKVDGSFCDQHVGGMLYRLKGGRIAYAWEDPEPSDEAAYALETEAETWLEYYSTVYDLYLKQGQDRESFKKRYGFNISVHKVARKFIDALIDGRDYSNEIGSLWHWSAGQLKVPVGCWNGDGIGIIMDERDQSYG
jgi:hypothetical protein